MNASLCLFYKPMVKVTFRSAFSKRKLNTHVQACPALKFPHRATNKGISYLMFSGSCHKEFGEIPN